MKKAAYLLLLTTVAVSACADQKTEEPAPVPPPMLTAPAAAPGYITANEDGVITTRPARAFHTPSSATQQYDQLTIATYDPATGKQAPGFQITYQKATGAADDTYTLVHVYVKYAYFSSTGTIVKVSGGWSGTFAGSFTPMKTNTTYWLGGGSFTDIKE